MSFSHKNKHKDCFVDLWKICLWPDPAFPGQDFGGSFVCIRTVEFGWYFKHSYKKERLILLLT